MPVVYEEAPKDNEICTHLDINRNSTVAVEYCKRANNLLDCEMPFYRGWFCFWNGILPSDVPYTCTHLIEYSREQTIVNKCKEIRMKAVCLLKTNPECQYIIGDPRASDNKMPKFSQFFPSKFQYLIIIDGENKVLNEDFKYKSPVLLDREEDQI